MLVDDDPGARRNQGDARGLWAINVLVGLLVMVLSLHVFRADETRDDVRTVVAAVEALPGQIAAPPAMAAPREE